MAKKRETKKRSVEIGPFIEEHKFIIASILFFLIILASIIFFVRIGRGDSQCQTRLEELENRVTELEGGVKVDMDTNKDEIKESQPVPVIEEKTETKEVVVSSNSAIVNINTASQSQLETLTGIGPVKAKAIIDYRQTKGSFKSISEIKNVSGIGDATFQKIKDKISI